MPLFSPWDSQSRPEACLADAVGPKVVRILGVHPILAPQPCHLLEVEIGNRSEEFDWGAVTQESPGQDRSNWQAAYDQVPLDEAKSRWVFFFHYLDFSKPLLTPVGALSLPAPTPLPSHLKQIEYVEP